MKTEYLQYACKTCDVVSYTRAVNAPLQQGKRLLRCSSGHQRAYDAEETTSLHLQTDRHIRAKMGLLS